MFNNRSANPTANSAEGYSDVLVRGCLLIGPVLFAMSTFFWEDGRYGATAGALIALSVPFWVYGMIAVLDRMRAVLPRYAATVLLLALLGAVGGTAFGFQGFFEQVYGLDKDASLAALKQYPLQAGVLLWWLGPLFPATLFAVGAGLVRTRQAPRTVAVLMCAGAVLFPLSRIPRVEWVAHLVDLLLITPFFVTAIRWRGRAAAPTPTTPAERA